MEKTLLWIWNRKKSIEIMKNVMEKPRESRFLVNQVAGFLKNRGFSVRHYLRSRHFFLRK